MSLNRPACRQAGSQRMEGARHPQVPGTFFPFFLPSSLLLSPPLINMKIAVPSTEKP